MESISLKKAHAEFTLAKSNLGGSSDKSKAMTAYNLAKTKLRHTCSRLRGKPIPKKYEKSFSTTIDGIPCGVVIEQYVPEDYSFEYATPNEPEIMEWFLVDQRGYRAEWLHKKMTAKEESNIDQRIREFDFIF